MNYLQSALCVPVPPSADGRRMIAGTIGKHMTAVTLTLFGVLIAVTTSALLSARRLRQSKREMEREIERSRKIERDLMENRNLLRTIIESEPECVKLLSADGTLLEINPAGAALLEAGSPGEIEGRCIYQFVSTEHRTAFADLNRGVFEGRAGILEFQIHGLRGQTRWMETHATPMRDATGAIVAHLAITRDITARRQAEDAARRHQCELMRVCRMVTVNEMATTLAHELNQPLAAISGYTEAMVELARPGRATGTQLAAVARKAARQAERAGAIVRRLRDCARHHETERRSCDINGILLEVIDFAGADARNREIELRLELAPTLPPVLADPVQIQQVFLNLVRNAIEAMEPAAGAPRLLTVRTHAGDSAVEVMVRDSGEGVPEALAGRVFDPFFTTKSDGMGIGLSISRTIMETHGGHLWLAPAVPRGTAACFSLPVAGVASN